MNQPNNKDRLKLNNEIENTHKKSFFWWNEFQIYALKGTFRNSFLDPKLEIFNKLMICKLVLTTLSAVFDKALI